MVVVVVLQSQSEQRPVVVAGCVPQGDRRLPEISGVSVVGVQQIERVVEVVEKTLEVVAGHPPATPDTPTPPRPSVAVSPPVGRLTSRPACLLAL